MIIRECDRCHLTNKDVGESFYAIEITSNSTDDDLDLCPHCYVEFANHFLNMNSTKETITHEQ